MPNTTMLDSKIKRLQRELKQLESQRASKVKDESESIKKINRATSSMSRTKNATTIKNKEREIQRENDKIQKAKERQADLLTKISKKNVELNNTMNDLGQSRQKEQNKIFQEQEKKMQEFKLRQNEATENFSSDSINEKRVYTKKEYDVFISYSTSDKDDYVNDLAEALKESDISVWYDSDSIGWGKSIRQEIDKGLSHSNYGIVIISPSFIEKYWTNYELDGILNKESSLNKQMILPIWHNITADQVKEYSYSLSNKLALNTALNTIDEIVENVKKILK